MAQTAQHGSGEGQHGQMDITDQRSTFSGFMAVTVWSGALTVMAVALLTIAFAMGAGWFPGLLAFTALGVGAGLVFKHGSAWWALLIGMVVLLGVGGAVVSLLTSMMA